MVAARLSLLGNYVAKFAGPGLDERAGARDADPHTGRVTVLAGVRRSVMAEKSVNELQPVSFGARLANSQVFADLFRDGMALVEETATYLDGPGRQESKKLERTAALAYATESMRLTTRLMQLASWLLLHRAVKEGEMSLAQANKEKSKVKLSAADFHDPHNLELLPAALRDLIERSHKLQGKVRRLDSTIHNHNAPGQAAVGNPVERQLGLLKAAFGAESV
jgi:regulator of CtrA degradation